MVFKKKPVAAEKPVTPAPTARRATGHVIVASKLPGSIILQLYERRNVRVQGRYGPLDEHKHVAVGNRYLIRGTGRPEGTVPKGFPRAPDMEGGAALTPNIPEDFWNAWLEQNRTTDMVRNGMIFAHSDRDSVADHCAEVVAEKSGLDPLDMDSGKESRLPKSFSSQVEDIETAVID